MIVLFGVFTAQVGLAQQSCGRVFMGDVGGKRSIETLRELKIMTYNAENLIVESEIKGGAQGHHDQAFKNDAELHQMRMIINENQPDFMVLQEVGSLESLQTLAKIAPLKGQYEPLLKEGNDHFHIGFLVKSDLNFRYFIESHKDVRFFDPIEGREMPVFSRDLPALMVMKEGSDKPVMIIFGNHAKSKRDRDGDPESNKLRTKQYEVAAEIIKGYQAKYGKDVPIMFAGDFNTDVQVAPEVAPLKAVLDSSFNWAKETDRAKDRITHTFHPSDEPTQYSQIDDVMISASLMKNVLEAHVIPYKDKNGKVLPPAKDYEERSKQPSDHRPIMIKISTEGFNTSWIAMPFDLVA
jgi:Endonuclease/Exonuclease/phosphatase family.